MTAAARVFPVFLKLAGRKVLVVGGGRVAAAKLEGLSRSGAHVTVVAPDFCREVASSGVTLRSRGFEPDDLDDVWYVVAAATPEVNRRVAVAAEERRVFVNAVDDPASASAYAGGVFRRGNLTVAISTEGEAPAVAGLLREALELLIPDDIETWLEESRRQKRVWRERAVPMPERRPLMLRALNRLYEENDSRRRSDGEQDSRALP
ncbi:MAG TPA: bifunctional precorrin-2 dehydrogenase/sirohydrochlorin ferrochelatase [Thermoanaerobaculia bacterium]|nr:bifunctional precorrin-2 dehydrogenase/sirohydrochlorin ferrochelatase [Thermoanaerobaculia bacterium]